MTKLITILIIVAALWGGWQLFVYWDKVKQEDEAAAKKKAQTEIVSGEQLSGMPNSLESSYQAYVGTTPRKPYPTMKGLQFLLDRLAPTMPQAKTAKPEQFVDMSFLQELEKEGFFNEMAKRYPGK